MLVVADDGAGVREADLPRLFERFYRADRARSSRGTGLGLAIVKHVVTSAGGTVEAHSAPGGGLEIVCRSRPGSRAAVDWRLYKAIYDISLHHHWVGDVFNAIEKVEHPGRWWSPRSRSGSWPARVATGNGSSPQAAHLAAAALALAVDQVIYKIHDRARPYEAHRISHPWTSKTDPSFPSDHASASLAIAFVVLMFDPLVGALFLTAAVLIAVGRVFIGAHYPGDVGASLVVAAVAAFVVVRFGRPVVAYAVRLFERVSDPLVRPLWRSSRTGP